MTEASIRETTPADLSGLEILYPHAFPDEDLLPLVRRLMTQPQGVVSLVAVVDGRVVGHIAFTICTLAGVEVRIALLGPLCVDPALHRQGIGSALVRAALARMEVQGVVQVNVLGDPAYYARFGFRADDAVKPPCTLPDDWAPAWQALQTRSAAAPLSGTLSVPAVWQDPALWAP